MVGNVTIQGQIVGTATFDGAKISAVVTIAPPINATVNFGGGISTIEQLPDPISDSSNIYGWIRSALLTGLSAFTDVTIAATDTILQGFAKLQGQLNAVKVRLSVLEGNIIFDTTLAAASSSLVITTDSLGVALSLNEVDIMIIHPAMPTNEMRLQVNDIATNYYTYAYYNRSSFAIICGYYGGVITGQLRYDAISHQLIGDFIGRSKYSATQYTSYVSSGFIEAPNMVNKVNKLVLWMATGQLPIGTRIVLKKAIR